MILHCKNAEMTIILLTVYNLCYFFFSDPNMFQIKKKNFFSIFYFYFFPSSDLNILRKKIRKPSIKKNKALPFYL